jgi:nicotinamidase-related amidase
MTDFSMLDNLTACLSEDDRWVIEHSAFGQNSRFPQRPALLVIDVTCGFLGLDETLQASLQVYPAGVGRAGWAALHCIQQLLRAARQSDLMVVFTRPLREEGEPGSVRRGKRRRTPLMPDENDFPAELQPGLTEWVFSKPAPSAFFGTSLAAELHARKVDGVIVTGFSTSGCVRATVVDAVSNNLGVIVPADAVADRLELSHQVSLLDISFKYGDVRSTDEVVTMLGSLASANDA